MRIVNCKTGHITNPLGFFIPKPVFTWNVEEAAGKKQTAARIVVSVHDDLSAPLVDTGFDNGLSCLGYAPQMTLLPRTRYYWTVTVRTDAGEEAVSEINWFETAKLDEPWNGHWITCEDGDRQPIFTKRFPAGRDITAARLYVCGLGIYEACLNGKKVGDEYLTPFCNDYSRWLQYQTFDITDALRKDGENLLSVTLGPGWYAGRFTYDASRGPYYGKKLLLTAEIRITCADGQEEVIGTDESWDVTRSRITFSNIYDGQAEDAILPEVPAVPAIPAETPKAPLTARYSLPVTVYRRLPVKLLHTPAGELVLDIGQNIAGTFSLRVHAPRGTKVFLQFGETLSDGNFYRDNLRTAKAEYTYIADGTDTTVEPHFTFYGGRYVRVQGLPDLKAEDFTALALSSALDRTGNLETGHPLVNQLISNAEWSCTDNFIDVPTDCPQRDERMGWTGDAEVFAPTASFMKDTYAFYRKFLHDCAEEQQVYGGRVPNVIPDFGLEGTSSVWGDAATIIPWVVYTFTGDVTILEEQFASMQSWVDYITGVDGDDCGWRRVFHFGDWLALDVAGAAPDNTFGATDEAFIADVYYMGSAEIVAAAAKVLGRTREEMRYGTLARQLRARILHEFYTPSGRCAVQTQTALLLTLRYGLSDPVKTAAALSEKLRKNHGMLSTGFVGTPMLCDQLSEHGLSGLAVNLLLNEDYPGWLHEVKLGATTIWERWNSLDDAGHTSSTGMNSLNHYSYGSVVEWIYRHLAGLISLKPGFSSVRLAPTPVCALKHLSAEYRSASGLWKSAWSVTDPTHLSVSVTVPFGCRAELVLPYASEEILETAAKQFAAGDKAFPVRDGAVLLPAGTWAFSYETAEPMQRILNSYMPVKELFADTFAHKTLVSLMPQADQLPAEMRGDSLRTISSRISGGKLDPILDRLDQILKG